MEPPYRLHYAPDNASLIVRLVLDEMALPYQTVLVDRARKTQKSTAYLALNPAGKIPTLETPQGVISETGAILLHLSETSGQMAPQLGDTHRPAFLKWLFFTANTLHPDLAMLFYADRFGPNTAVPAIRQRAIARIKHALMLLDAVADSDVPWFGGNAPSVLDYYVGVILRWCVLYPMNNGGWFHLSDTPALNRLALHLETRSAMMRAIQAEGLGERPLSCPQHPTPPEGVSL